MPTIEQLNRFNQGYFPAFIGIVITQASTTEIQAELAIQPPHKSPNGFLHAGVVVSLADTACGYGCAANLPKGASGFTTVELKSNHLGTAREGSIACVAKPVHVGRTTQVWDATVTHRETGKTIALFRCTQMILYTQSSM